MKKMKRQRSGKDNRKGKHVFGVRGGISVILLRLSCSSSERGAGVEGLYLGYITKIRRLFESEM